MVCKPPKIRLFILEYCCQSTLYERTIILLFLTPWFDQWSPASVSVVSDMKLGSSLESVQVCFGGYFVEDQPVSTKNIVSTLHQHQHSHSQAKQTKLGSSCASFIRTRSVSKIKVAIQVNTRIYSSADNADSKFVSEIHIPVVFQSVMWCRCTAKLNLTNLR